MLGGTEREREREMALQLVLRQRLGELPVGGLIVGNVWEDIQDMANSKLGPEKTEKELKKQLWQR